MEESVDPYGIAPAPTESDGDVRRSRPSSATMGKFRFFSLFKNYSSQYVQN